MFYLFCKFDKYANTYTIFLNVYQTLFNLKNLFIQKGLKLELENKNKQLFYLILWEICIFI
jgi:hypothetical protein